MRRIPVAVTHRICPGNKCGYLMPHMKVASAIFNFKCPKCKEYNLNDFQPLRLSAQNKDKEE
jgi:phage FluMu protein Com